MYLCMTWQWRIPPPFQLFLIKNEDLFFNNFVIKNVFCEYLYTI